MDVLHFSAAQFFSNHNKNIEFHEHHTHHTISVFLL